MLPLLRQVHSECSWIFDGRNAGNPRFFAKSERYDAIMMSLVTTRVTQVVSVDCARRGHAACRATTDYPGPMRHHQPPGGSQHCTARRYRPLHAALQAARRDDEFSHRPRRCGSTACFLIFSAVSVDGYSCKNALVGHVSSAQNQQRSTKRHSQCW